VFTWLNMINLGLALLSALLLTAVFPPVELSFFAFVALIPWLVVVSRTGTKTQLVISYLAGLAFFFLNDLWIVPITIPGYISMSIYLGLYWPATGFLVQRLLRRWSLPLFLAAPAVWVSFEYIRSWMITGFPWFFLGHSQARNLSLIQIADLTGVYGISFMLAMINGAIVELILSSKNRQFRRAIPALVSAGVALLATFFYGQFRLHQTTTRPGPVLAVVQEDFPMFVDTDAPDCDEILQAFMAVSVQAAQTHPDMLIWPETCVGVPVNPEFLNATVENKGDKSEQRYARGVADYLGKHAKRSNSYLLLGALSRQINPPGHSPAEDKFNSAVIFDRQGNYMDRYDKIRLVLFGEVVPFRYTIPKLYWFLNEHMTPYGKGGYEYSLTAGREPKRFTLVTPAENLRYSVAICYEDTMSDLIAGFVSPVQGKKQIDFLVNISNDGWFNHSCELIQHFYMCVFRAVENRIAVARSVNTGISGFVNPDGSIEAMMTDGSRIYGPGIRGFLTRQIKIDSRSTVYSIIGEWPVLVLTVLVMAFGVVLPFFVKPDKIGK